MSLRLNNTHKMERRFVASKRDVVRVAIFFLIFLITFLIFDSIYFLLTSKTNDDDNLDEFAYPLQWWYLTVNETTPNCGEDLTLWKNWKPRRVNVNIVFKTCEKLKAFWKFPTKALSDEENEYPLAFVITGHENTKQTLRLFRAIYHPQNLYCINVDKNSTKLYKQTVTLLTQCLPNVVIPRVRRVLKPCYYSFFTSTMDCLKLLYEHPRSWKYVQILSWNDFPLKTNREMVQIFQILNGTVDSSLGSLSKKKFRNILRRPKNSNKSTKVRYMAPPHGLNIYRSEFPVTLTREFIEFMFTSEIAQDLYSWFNRSKCVEEMYFSTLIHNDFINAPGNFPGSCYQFFENDKIFISQFQISDSDAEKSYCRGAFHKKSCVFGVEDVELLKEQYSLMAHQFNDRFQPAALFCLEQWHYEKTMDQVNLTDDMISYYSNMQSVLYTFRNDTNVSFTCE